MGRPRTLPDPEPRKCQFEYCGKVFTPRRKTVNMNAIYCSRFCQRRAMAYSHNSQEFAQSTATTRGDKLRGTGRGNGYIKRGGRHEHRVVAEEMLGRPLLPGETVHHKDRVKSHNDPSNLVVYPSQGEHARLHSTKNRKCEIEDCNSKHFCKGYCRKHYQRVVKYGSTDLPVKCDLGCTTSGCDRPHYSKGLCNMHWQRARKGVS